MDGGALVLGVVSPGRQVPATVEAHAALLPTCHSHLQLLYPSEDGLSGFVPTWPGS